MAEAFGEVDLGGVAIRVAVSGRSVPVVEGLLGSHRRRSDPCIASLSVLDGEPARPGGAAVRELHVEVDGGAVRVFHPAGANLEVKGPAATLTVSPLAPLSAIRRMTILAVGFLLEPHDLFLLHAGAVEVGPGCALVLGASGAGKSTTVIGAMHAGRGAWSDDLVICRRLGGRHLVTGLRRKLLAPSDLPGIAGNPAEDDPRGRQELSVESLRTDWVQVVATVEVHHGSVSALHRSSATAAVPVLVGASLAAWSPASLTRWFPHAAAIARLGCWSLRHDPDPMRRLSAGAGQLDRLEQELTLR